MTMIFWRRTMIACAAALAMLAGQASAQDGSADETRCEALARGDYASTPDAPFSVTAANVVSPEGARGYCRVEGYVLPEITFEIRLPTTGWNRRFVLIGGGGWATEKFLFLCREPLRRGYACIAGDGGHQSRRGLWMRGNPQGRIDWGYRATHVTALAGKSLVAAFYGSPPELSLMMGTSTGGYQALVEAQRFPWDFDGIVAIAPDVDAAGLAMRTEWTARNLRGAGGAPLFTGRDLALLHRAAVAGCDLSDGVRDGVIGDALGCVVDLAAITCKRGLTTECLTPGQAAAAARIYAGPMTTAGEQLSAGGLLPGSELGWSEVLDDTFPDEFFRNAFADQPGDGFPAARFDFDADYRRLGLAGSFLSSNPDLRRFRQAGGKLMIVQGATDVVEQPPVIVDYYETVSRVAGERSVRDFARLFVVPGMNHSTGGEGAFAIDYLTAIERWAGEGEAPDVLVAAHVPEWAGGRAAMMAGLTAPGSDVRSTFTRPVYPYPLVARHDGRRDADDHRSFRPVAPGR